VLLFFKIMNNQQLFNLLASIDATRAIVIAEIRKLDWQHLAANGLKIDAIVVYRNKFKVDLKNAKEAVDSFINSNL